MKTLIKLLLAAAILHAAARAGISATAYFRLKDSSQQLLVFGGDVPPAELRASIVARAEELNVPLAPENVVVRRQGVRTTAQASYIDVVELLPGYRYPITYSFNVQAMSIR